MADGNSSVHGNDDNNAATIDERLTWMEQANREAREVQLLIGERVEQLTAAIAALTRNANPECNVDDPLRGGWPRWEHNRREANDHDDLDEDGRRRRREEEDRHRRHHGLKLNIPHFAGDSDAGVYQDWEAKADQVFRYCRYTEVEKVDLATIHFTDFALTWWREERDDREYHGELPVETWAELKRLMRARFFPIDYEQ